MASVFEALTIAIEHQQAGRRQAAEQIYRQILDADPRQPDALHLLGVLAHDAGQHDIAVDYIQRAIGLRETAHVFHLNLGNALKAQGRVDEAIASYRRALALKPDFVEAHSNLGNALRDQHQPDEAIAHFRQALELRPDFAEAHNNLGNAFNVQKRFQEAIACYHRATEIKPHYAEALNNLGAAQKDCGQLDAAIAAFRRALELNADYVEAYFNLGNALVERRNRNAANVAQHGPWGLKADFADASAEFGDVSNAAANLHEAVGCYRRAIELRPGFAEAHHNLGIVLEELNQSDEATACQLRALTLRPDYVEAAVSLGDLHADMGQIAEAEACFRRALEIKPELPVARVRLAHLLRGKLPKIDRDALEARIADSKLDQSARAQLEFALAHVLDDQGDYDRAAELLRQANSRRLELDRVDRPYSPAEYDRLVDDIIGEFDHEFFQRLAGAGLNTRRPVFIVGLPRSGTTLIEQILASHSRVHGAGELLLASETIVAMLNMLGCSGASFAGAEQLDPLTLRCLAAQHLEKLAAIDDGRFERIVDKMPENYLHLGLLAAMFPQAVVIYCRRDLRDVALSCWMTDFVDIRWANNAEHIGDRFRQYLRLMDHWRSTFSTQLHEIDYEEAVTDLEGVARRLLAACQLDWEPACLEFHQTRRPVRTASRIQVRQPIYKRSVARWKNYERLLPELFSVLPDA